MLKIDLQTPLADELNKQLGEFFSTQEAHTCLWAPNITYQLPDGVKFELKQTVLKRSRKKDASAHRYEVVSEEFVGDGSSGQVYKIAATMKIEAAGLMFKFGGQDWQGNATGKSRVIKVQFMSPEWKNWIINENIASLKVPHLHFKPAVIVDFTSYAVMRELHSEDLFDFIAREYNISAKNLSEEAQKERMTVNIDLPTRLALSVELLRAYCLQVKGLNFVHRDVKPGNIKIELIPTNCSKKYEVKSVQFFDYAMARYRDVQDKKFCGSPVFAAPEMMNQQSTDENKEDEFSLARVLCQLWHINYFHLAFPEFKDLYANLNEVNLDDLFIKLDDLDFLNRHNIREILRVMHDSGPKRRLSAEQALQLFESIDLVSPCNLGDDIALCLAKNKGAVIVADDKNAQDNSIYTMASNTAYSVFSSAWTFFGDMLQNIEFPKGQLHPVKNEQGDDSDDDFHSFV